jgi:hypothetical protein
MAQRKRSKESLPFVYIRQKWMNGQGRSDLKYKVTCTQGVGSWREQEGRSLRLARDNATWRQRRTSARISRGPDLLRRRCAKKVSILGAEEYNEWCSYSFSGGVFTLLGSIPDDNAHTIVPILHIRSATTSSTGSINPNACLPCELRSWLLHNQIGLDSLSCTMGGS